MFKELLKELNKLSDESLIFLSCLIVGILQYRNENIEIKGVKENDKKRI